jgi:sugar-phosphatase
VFFVAAFLFDMDGVLLDSRRVVERTWRRWGERHGIPVEPILRIAHGRRTRDTLRAMVPHLATDEEVAWLDATELADLDIQPIPGARELVHSLPPDRWTVVTSAGRELARLRLRAVGIELPAHAVTSEDILNGKPSPEGYLLGASRLGVAATECVVVEDTPPGLAAGKAAGAKLLGVTTTHVAAQLGEAGYLISDLLPVRATMDESGTLLQVSLLTDNHPHRESP